MPTPPLGDADFQAVLDGLGGVVVTVGGTSARGILRQSDVPLDVEDPGGAVGVRQVSVLVRSATFDGLVPQGTAITVDGVSYKVATSVMDETGIRLRIFLARP